MPGNVYFLTSRSSIRHDLHQASNKRTYTLWETIANTIKDGPTLYLVLDEAHRGMRTPAKADRREAIAPPSSSGSSTATTASRRADRLGHLRDRGALHRRDERRPGRGTHHLPAGRGRPAGGAGVRPAEGHDHARHPGREGGVRDDAAARRGRRDARDVELWAAYAEQEEMADPVAAAAGPAGAEQARRTAILADCST